MSKRFYKCYNCGGIIDHFNYRKDSSPAGEDEAVCPLCGAIEAGADEVQEPEGWHPMTEKPELPGDYLLQHYYRTWSGEDQITYEIHDLPAVLEIIDHNGTRNSHYQAWMKINPFQEDTER